MKKGHCSSVLDHVFSTKIHCTQLRSAPTVSSSFGGSGSRPAFFLGEKPVVVILVLEMM